MDPAAASLPCLDCGTLTPRVEMFGLAPDLRCGACAETLRTRLHPSVVRRGPSTFRRGSGEPRATVALLATMGVIWIALQISATSTWLETFLFYPHVVYAANGRPLDVFLQPWQPALWALTHVEIWHLAMNGLTLFSFGRWIELGWGPRKLLFVTLGSAMFGTGCGYLINAAPTIGISGGLFGLIAFLLALRRHHPVASALMTRSTLNALLANIVLLTVLTEFSGIRISHVGHGTGFLWGLAAGFAARRPRPLPLFLLLAALTLVAVLLPAFVYPMGREQGWWEQVR